MRTILVFALLTCFGVCFASSTVQQQKTPSTAAQQRKTPSSATQQRKIPPAKAVIEFKATPGTVTLKHEEHAVKYNIACQTCHHTLQASEAQPKPCSACHLKTGTAKIPSLQNAVHKKCWTCHKEEVAKGKKAPLQTPCTGCHVKAKA